MSRMPISNSARRPRGGAIALVAFVMITGHAYAQEQPATPQQTPESTAASDAAAAAMAANSDWPCIQHKQPVLTAAQMWDGPEIASEGANSEDESIRKLVPIIVSRRLSVDDVEKDIKAFADALPAGTRDAKLAELFSAVLAEINVTRSSAVNGIEKFQRRQVLRSKKLEADGIKLAELITASDANLKDQAAAQNAQEAQSRYDWDARVFQERQQNIPIACEIPVLIEQRAFAIAQSIRNLMDK